MNVIVAAILFWGGLILIFAADEPLRPLGGLAMVVGFFWWLIAKFLIWWHHK
jgi:hypothetical protein